MENRKTTALMPIISDCAAPAALSAIAVSACAYMYAGEDAAAIAVFTAVSVILSAVLFAIYETLRRIGKNWLTTAVTAGLVMLSGTAAPRLADMSRFSELGLWFMEPSRFTQVYYGNTLSLIFTIGFVLISCLFYFTRVMYRGVFVFLICLCPFCLFAKTFTEIPVIYPILIMTLFFFIMIRGRSEGGTDEYVRRSSLTVPAVAFVLAVTVIASFLPKAEHAPFREDFDEFITGVSIAGAGTENFNDFTDNSSNTTSRDDGKVIFVISGDNPRYIKRQCFNLYDAESNTWGYYGDNDSGTSNWRKFTAFEDPTLFYSAAGITAEAPTVKTCGIKTVEGRFRAVYTPENIQDLEMPDERKIFRTELDEYFIEDDRRAPVTEYRMTWTEFTPIPDFADMFTDGYARELAASGDTSVSDEAKNYILAKEQAVQYNGHLLSDSVMSACYRSGNDRRRVRELAEEVTADCGSDYERAAALVQLFRGGDYIYDKDFTSPDGSPVTFIFRTKRGACAAYATAMTLMCRELGMTARYCEGFLVQSNDPATGNLYVTSGDSHAYVQVWIDGYGWTDFDPTSSITDDGYFDLTFVFVGAAAALIVALGALVIFLRPRLEEAAYLKRIKNSRGTAQYSLIYRRINRAVNEYIKAKTNTLTPSDTAEKCAEEFGYDIGGFVLEYENAVYGGKADESADNTAVYEGFTAAYKAKIKEERKNGRKWVYSVGRK